MRGGSCIVDPAGKVLAGPAFDEEKILVADLDLDPDDPRHRRQGPAEETDLPGQVSGHFVHLAHQFLAQPGVVTADWVKPGAVLIDFNPIVTGWTAHRDDPDRLVPKLVGGIDVASAAQVAGTIVPVPGGVGPAMLGVLVEQIVALEAREEYIALGDTLPPGLHLVREG